MNMYRVFPDPRLHLDLTTPDGLSELRNLYRMTADHSVRVNMIATPGGDTVGADNTSGSLSSSIDRQVLTLLRSLADVVIIGAETIRRERLPLPTGIPLVVVSRSGDVPAANLIRRPDSGELIVLTHNGEMASKTLGDTPHRIISPPTPSPNANDIIEVCRQEGWKHILVEGGQDVVSQFAEADAIDDLCLTLTQAPQTTTSPPVSWWPVVASWQTIHLLTDDNRMLYHRYTREHKKAV